MLVTTRTDTFLDGKALNSSKISLPWETRHQASETAIRSAAWCPCWSYLSVAGGVNADVFSGQTPVERRHIDLFRGRGQKILPGFIQTDSGAHVSPVIQAQRKTLHQNNTGTNHTSTPALRLMTRFIKSFSTENKVWLSSLGNVRKLWHCS